MKISRAILLAGALSCLAAPHLASAQEYATDRGSLILGGSGGLTRTTVTDIFDGVARDRHTTTWHLSPMVQYFVSPGIALGGIVNLRRTSRDGQGTTFYGVGPTASYYFGRGEQKLHPYVSGNATLNRATGTDGSAYGWGASVGSLYMLSRAVGLDVGLFYRWRGFSDSETDASEMGLSLGFSAFTF